MQIYAEGALITFGALWLLATVKRFGMPNPEHPLLPRDALLHGLLAFAMVGVGGYGLVFLDKFEHLASSLLAADPGSEEYQEARDEALVSLAQNELPEEEQKKLRRLILSTSTDSLSSAIARVQQEQAVPNEALVQLDQDWRRRQEVVARAMFGTNPDRPLFERASALDSQSSALLWHINPDEFPEYAPELREARAVLHSDSSREN